MIRKNTAVNSRPAFDSNDGDAASEWSDELDAREQEIEERADFSYEPIVDFLRTHDRDFSFSILSYCQEKPES